MLNHTIQKSNKIIINSKTIRRTYYDYYYLQQRKTKRQSPCTSHRMHKGISLFQKHGHLTITFFPFIIYMPFGRPSVDVVPWRTICPLMLNTFLDDSSFHCLSFQTSKCVKFSQFKSNSPFRQITIFPQKTVSIILNYKNPPEAQEHQEENLINKPFHLMV